MDAARLVVIAVCCACGSGGGGRADAGLAAPDGRPDAVSCQPTASVDAAPVAGSTPLERLADGFCQGMSRCGEITANWGHVAVALADPVRCRAQVLRLARFYPGLPFPEFEREGSALDPGAADACAARLAEVCPYNDLRRMAGPGYPDPCEAMLVAAAPVPAGGTCRHSGDCAEGLACAPSSPGCGWECAPSSSLGALCSTAESCPDPPGDDFAACIYSTTTFEARCGGGRLGPLACEGQACGALASEDLTSVVYVGCRDGLLCVGEGWPGSPAKAVAWSAGVCRPALEPGENCLTGSCPLGTACDDCGPGLPGPICLCGTSLPALPGEAEPCAATYPRCDVGEDIACAAGSCLSVPEPGAEGDPCKCSMICRPYGPPGSPETVHASPDGLSSLGLAIVTPECRVWTTCAAGLYCRGEFGSISTGECAPQLAEGSACFPNTDSCATGNCACASGNCVSDPSGGWRCAPAVSCE